MKKLILSFFVTCLMSGLIYSQTTITGTVTSKKDGTPVSGAKVSVKKHAEISVVTDVNGSYSINVPQGGKVLEVTAAGFTPKKEGIGNKKVINFKMTGNNKGTSGKNEKTSKEKEKGGKGDKGDKGNKGDKGGKK